MLLNKVIVCAEPWKAGATGAVDGRGRGGVARKAQHLQGAGLQA